MAGRKKCAVLVGDGSRRRTSVASAVRARHEQEEQNEDDQKYDRPSCITAKCAHVQYLPTNGFYLLPECRVLVDRHCGALRRVHGDEQEEKHKDDEKYDRPSGIAAKRSFHRSETSF